MLRNDLIEWTFHREDSLYLACNVRNAFFTSEVHKNYSLWTCQKVCEAPTFLLDNIYIRFGTKLFRQIVGIPMGTNCAPLVTDLFLFCYERDFMVSLSVENQSEIIEAFSSASIIIITIYGRVKKSVMPLFSFWIIFLLDLELNFID